MKKKPDTEPSFDTPYAVLAQNLMLNKCMSLCERHRRALATREAKIKRDVIYEKGEDGKYRFSNETTREVELRLRLEKDTAWLRLNARLQQIEDRRREALAQLEFARDMLREKWLARKEALAVKVA